MKIYRDVFVSEKKLVDVICNMCGEKIKKTDNGVLCDYFHSEKEWGYFSELDGEKYSFDLCQTCYKKLLNQLQISAKNDEKQNDKT